MTHRHAVDVAVDIVKATLADGKSSLYPNDKSAKDVADFVETLAARLEKMNYSAND